MPLYYDDAVGYDKAVKKDLEELKERIKKTRELFVKLKDRWLQVVS